MKQASDMLVKAVQESRVFEIDEVDAHIPNRGQKTGLLINEIEANEAILVKQRELDQAKRKLEQIRIAKYKRGQSMEEEGVTHF